MIAPMPDVKFLSPHHGGAGGLRVVEAADDLAAIRAPNVAGVIWRRQLSADFVEWIEDLDPAQLPRVRMILRPDAVSEAVRTASDDVGMPESAGRSFLIDDIREQASRFADIMGAPYLRLRMDVVTTDACRRFHRDAISARLVCSYRGPGTQYGISPDGTEPDRIFTVGQGAPIVLRGSKWPEDPDAGLLHRSPPIEGMDITRLVLVLDPIFDPEDEM